MKRLQQAAADLTRRGRSRWVCIEWTLENIVRSYILYLYCYLYLCHNHHHCIEWPLGDIVRRYITGNPPFISHWLPHSFNGCFSSNSLLWDVTSLGTLPRKKNLSVIDCHILWTDAFPPISQIWSFIRMDRGRYQMLPSGWGKSICLFFVSCCLSDDVRARIFRGFQSTLVSFL